jgi:hypothetical protein
LLIEAVGPLGLQLRVLNPGYGRGFRFCLSSRPAIEGILVFPGFKKPSIAGRLEAAFDKSKQ